MPYKEKLLLSRVTRIAVATVKQAIAEQQAKPLPSALSQGYFMVVEQSPADLDMAMFKYDKVEGCSNIIYPLHGLLPVPSKRHRDVAELTREPRLHVGIFMNIRIPTKLWTALFI